MKYALHSVSYAGRWKGQAFLTLEDFIRKAAALGYDGVEIMAKRPHLSPLDTDDARLRALGALLKDEGVECSCIAGYTDFLLGIDSMIAPAELQILYVERLCAMAQALGCTLVRVFTGYEDKAVAFQRQWDHCVDALRECARRAAKYRITLGIQNHHDIGADHRAMKELLADIGEPNCLPMFDAWLPAQMGADLAEAVRAIAPIAYTTVADYVRLPTYAYNADLLTYRRGEDLLKAVPMGEGFIDYPAFFAALRATGFDGTVAYEMCSPLRGGGSLPALDAHASAFLAAMRSL